MRPQSIVVGLMLILAGTAGFMAWRDPAVLLTAAFGAATIAIAFVLNRRSLQFQSIAAMIWYALLMIISTSAIPRAGRMIAGAEPFQGRSIVIAVQGLIALVAITTAIRTYFRSSQHDQQT